MKTLLIPHFLFQEQLPFGRIKVFMDFKNLINIKKQRALPT